MDSKAADVTTKQEVDCLLLPAQITEDTTNRYVASMTYGDSDQYWVGFDSPATLAAKVVLYSNMVYIW